MRSLPMVFAGLVLTIAVLPAQATVTVLNQWHMGEADAGATAGGAGAASTVDSVGAFNLNKVGAPTYASDVPPRIGSTLSMAFNGTTDEYNNTTAVASALTDNFGIEAWVKSNGSTTGNAAIAYNGNTSTAGWGIYRFGANYGVLYGGNIGAPVTPISTQWMELALVRDNGTTTFYVNGVASYTTAVGPNAPAGGVGIGGNPLLSGFELFDGKIDEVRIFSFAPGAFSVGDLNLPPPVPTPALSLRALGLLGLGMLGLAWLGLRRRKANTISV
ncbi:MAG: LamG domain-containing protein [Xanthomonadaceae bacterium]|nr:LamG domain-containing protein [Xanthomonadaceae bacterium]